MGDSPLISRYLLAQMAGLQFSGKRDLYEVFGYKKALTYGDLYAKYKRQDIASRVVDEPVKAIWSNPPEIANAALTEPWNKLQNQFDLWQAFARADRLLAFGEFSILLLGLPGNSERAVGAVPKGDTTRNLLYVQPYSTNEVEIHETELNPSSPRFGLPLYYMVDLGKVESQQNTSTSKSRKVKVHYSRIIHLTDPLLVDNTKSAPRLEKVYNILDDLLKVVGGSAETYWLTANRGMQINIDKDMDLTSEDETALTDELEEFQHQLRRYVRTRGVEINSLGEDVTDPSSTFEVLIAALASATGIPQRILMGAEAGQLASEQDRANWAVQVEARRAEFAEPYVIKPFIRKMGELGVLPQLPEEAIDIKWGEAFRMSPLERAQEMAQKARSIVNLSRQAQYSHPIVTTDEARAILGLEPDASLPSVEEGVDYAWATKGLDPETGEPIQQESTEDPNDPEAGDEVPQNRGAPGSGNGLNNQSSNRRKTAAVLLRRRA